VNQGTARIWRTATGKDAVTLSSPDRIETIDFTPSGRVIATGNPETVRLWDAVTGTSIVVLAGLPRSDIAPSLLFGSNDRRIFVTPGRDGAARQYVCNACGSYTDVLEQARAEARRLR
jgi:WD40 repeat protein